ncbi:pectate lyase [Arthrobacter sp. JZ12]|uniref:pectate lyase family protein n=1 Tax=Arthrobacter sp. JZ12 TaxID=2654190 RepID=UPI002B489508|nr:pectate lyase [Arthrobacter sp. JZ12]
MSLIRPALALFCTAALAATAAPPVAAAPPSHAAPPSFQASGPLEQQTLPAGDGWGSAGNGTTGGAGAAAHRIYDVDTRAELKSAFAEAGDEKKIIRVHGELLGNADDAGSPLSCDDYAAGTGYSIDAYLAAYSPETWGWDREPEGELEDARNRAAQKQRATMLVDVPSNTTIVGATSDATLNGLSLRISGETNVIVRNLHHKGVIDCFPQWDPTDGSSGNWNSEYDMVQIINGTTNVWMDHNSYTDDPYYDDEAPVYFGRLFQQHDGAIDMTNGSDLITVSYNRFADRDKLMLIGSTDSPGRGDPGKLRITLHHNEFINVGQRAPRLRFGQVDAYNNHFVVNDESRIPYQYSLGAGFDSHLWAEANAFSLTSDIDPSEIIAHWKGTRITTIDNTINGKVVDLREAYNASAPADKQLAEDTSWQPVLRTLVHPAQAVPSILKGNVGPVFTAEGSE